MNKIEKNLEREIIILLSNCLRKELDPDGIRNHPIRVLDAAKSMIGLNLDNPSLNLFNYIQSKNISSNISDINSNIIDNAETVSIYELEEAINQGDLNESNRIITQLLKLSDGRHILEYLLELSLKQYGKSLSVIWPIYKTLSFIGYSSTPDTRNGLFLAAQSLIYDKPYKLNNIKSNSIDLIFDEFTLNNHELQIIGVIYEISNNKFIRKDFIKNSLKSFIEYFKTNLKKSFPLEQLSSISIDNRADLLEILESLEISDKNILNINALRSYMKNCSNINNDKLSYYISSIQEA